jgi:DNA polymerase-3 subunit beta
MTQTISAPPQEPQIKQAIAVSLSALDRAVAQLARIATDRPKHPILANILIKCQGDRLWLTACDLKVFSQVSVEIDNPQGESWEMLLPAQLLNKLLKRLPAEYWFLTPKTREYEDLLAIEIANSPEKPTSRYLLHAFPENDFPRVPDMEVPSLSFEVDAEKLRKAIAAVKPAAATHGKFGNEKLEGIYIQVQGDRLQLFASDGHRLVTQFVDGKGIKTEDAPTGVFITHDFANQLCDSLWDRGTNRTLPDTITLHFNSVWSWIEAAGTRIFSGLNQESFPISRLQEHLTAPEWNGCVERRLLRKALQRLKPLIKEEKKGIRLESCEKDQVITVSCGDSEEWVSAQVKRSGRSLFNFEYLDKALACLDAVDILFTLDPKRVCHFGVLGDKALHAIMPIDPPAEAIARDTASEKADPVEVEEVAKSPSPGVPLPDRSGHVPTKERSPKRETKPKPPTPAEPTPPVQSEDQVRILVRFKRPWMGFSFQPAWVGFSLEGRSWEVQKPGKRWMSKLQSQIVSLDEKEAIAELVVPQSELEFWKIAA